MPFRPSLTTLHGPPALTILNDLDVRLTGRIRDTLHDEPRLIATIDVAQKFEQQILGRVVPGRSGLS